MSLWWCTFVYCVLRLRDSLNELGKFLRFCVQIGFGFESSPNFVFSDRKFDFGEYFHFENGIFYLAEHWCLALLRRIAATCTVHFLPFAILFGKFNLLEDEKLYLVYLCASFAISIVRFVLKSGPEKDKEKKWLKYDQVHSISLIDKHNKRKSFCWCRFFGSSFYIARVFGPRMCVRSCWLEILSSFAVTIVAMDFDEDLCLLFNQWKSCRRIVTDSNKMMVNDMVNVFEPHGWRTTDDDNQH